MKRNRQLRNAAILMIVTAGFFNLKMLASPPKYKVYSNTEREPKGSITVWSATNIEDSVVFNFHNNTSGSNWIVTLRLSEGHDSGGNPPSEREPKGSRNIYWNSWGGAKQEGNPNIDFYLHNSVSGSNWVSSVTRYKSITLPYILKDVDSGITYEVEEDGRHVSATDSFGALLWYRDPFADAHLEFYRTHNPRIVAFALHKRCDSEDWSLPEEIFHKKGIKKFISVGFNSSQFGYMDVTSGDFFFMGNN